MDEITFPCKGILMSLKFFCVRKSYHKWMRHSQIRQVENVVVVFDWYLIESS